MYELLLDLLSSKYPDVVFEPVGYTKVRMVADLGGKLVMRTVDIPITEDEARRRVALLERELAKM